MREVTEAILEVLQTGERAALATVIRTRGSAPQSIGARLLMRASLKTVGTVGGGAVERRVEEALASCLQNAKPRVLTFDLGRDLGMCCGGGMEFFVEAIEETPRLVLFGAGHVAKPTAALAQSVGFRVVVVDDREELNTVDRFPGCERILAEPHRVVDEVSPRASDWFLIVTHDHHLDELALDAYARHPHRYLGMIGSKRKVFRVLARIKARGDLPPLEKVYAPVGLDLGAVSPEEIAVSIASELTALRRGRSGPHMRAIDHPGLARVLDGTLTPEDASALPDTA